MHILLKAPRTDTSSPGGASTPVFACWKVSCKPINASVRPHCRCHNESFQLSTRSPVQGKDSRQAQKCRIRDVSQKIPARRPHPRSAGDHHQSPVSVHWVVRLLVNFSRSEPASLSRYFWDRGCGPISTESDVMGLTPFSKVHFTGV